MDKYLYTTVNDNEPHPHVRSSCTFEKGINFFVLRKPVLSFYSMLLICEESTTFTDHGGDKNPHMIGIFDGYPHNNWTFRIDLFAVNLGILVDMEHKKCIFYDYDKKIKIPIRYIKNNDYAEGYEAPIDFEKAKVVALLKRSSCNNRGVGITILNEGCIPVPNWV